MYCLKKCNANTNFTNIIHYFYINNSLKVDDYCLLYLCVITNNLLNN